MKGEWSSGRVAIRWEYVVTVRCGVCGRGERLTGTYDRGEEGPFVGSWRRLRGVTYGTHDDPFAEDEIVVCGPLCFTEAQSKTISEVWPA